MVRLNHSVKVGNKTVTPFLVEGESVYCFNKMRETIILQVGDFKPKKEKRVVVPFRVTAAPFVPVKKVVVLVPEPVIEEEVKPSIYNVESSFVVKVSGQAKTSYVKKVFVAPPVVDNSRYVRPTLDDDYI
jgi:hypothetical protein